MATDSIRLSTVIAVEPGLLYRAWMDAGEHGAFTGGTASIEPWVGGRYTVSDGYIEGTTLELDPPRRIIQTWRTAEFPEGSMDSRLELTLVAVPGGTELTLIHTEIPEGQGEKYRQGWEEYYFKPMKEYFERPAGAAEAPTPAKPKEARKAAPRPKAKPKAKAKAAKRPARKTARARSRVKAKAKAKRKVMPKRKAKPKRKATPRRAARPARKKKAARRTAKRSAKKVARRARSRRAPKRAARRHR